MFAKLDVARLKSLLESQHLSQSELAKTSGVSRPQLVRLLASAREVRVREDTVNRLARALQTDPIELAAGGKLERFRLWVAEEHNFVDFRGIGMPNVRKEPIEEVFVDVDLSLDDTCEGGDDCTPAGSVSSRKNGDSSQPIPATECIATHDRVVVLGHPGCGKTTVLRFMAHQCATRNDGDAETPIYIRLPELCRARELDEGVDPIKFVAARAVEGGCPDVESYLREELADDRRRCLVLLDGLDEVGGQEQRGRLIDCIRTLVEQYPRNRYAITSRVMGFERAPWRSQGFAVYRMRKYGATQLKTFADKWATILSRARGEPYEEVLGALKTAIFLNPRVRAIASNPLILTILVLLHEARGGNLPRRRVDLYEKVVDVFLDTWEGNKRSAETFNDTRSIDLDGREFRWLLSDLSLAMQKNDRTVAPRWWLVEKMQECLQQKLGFEPENAKDACDGIIRYLTERTGLIEERGLDLFGFSHRTLQEYFASLGVIDEADASTSRDVTACLRGYYYHPQWSEVVRLVAAQLAPPLAESVISTILDDPDPVGRFLRRGQLLALGCLSDGTTVPNRRLVAGIFDSLADLGRSRWLRITLESIDALDDFEGTRWQNLAKNTVTGILETARNELDADEYECLYQRVYLSEIFESARQKLSSEFPEAAREVAVTHDGTTHCLVRLNATLLRNDPKKWRADACSRLQDPGQSERLKLAILSEVGRRASTDRRSRIVLRKTLCSPAEPPIRAACASLLGARTKGKHNIKLLLMPVLEKDRDPLVRGACAAALEDAAVDDASVRRRLIDVLSSGEPAAVRAGAARGLEKAATSDRSALDMLKRCALSEDEPEDVRTACAWALQPRIGEDSDVTEAFKSWLDDGRSPKLRRIAAEALPLAMADETLPWDYRLVERVEGILMGLENPCPCALRSLEALATARAIRGGLRLESVLRDALRPLGDQVELAFVFGSTARNRQQEESDIDLLVIGEVNLKALSGPLREAERILGRRINPVIYTRDSFRQKHHAGDPFLLEVCRREKIPVIPARGESSRRDLDDELRAMVAERMAPTE